MMERNRKAGQIPPRVVAPIEEEEEDVLYRFTFQYFFCLKFSNGYLHEVFYTILNVTFGF
jgi:hypothetical protein